MVTTLDEFSPGLIYDVAYCARGQAENFIKTAGCRPPAATNSPSRPATRRGGFAAEREASPQSDSRERSAVTSGRSPSSADRIE
ncbi:MAG: hypothetical protein KF773_19645 [Deltaproteobacteria bacterium]|nr:hypothetical protein [Deltaproteobacteria bacterium]